MIAAFRRHVLDQRHGYKRIAILVSLGWLVYGWTAYSEYGLDALPLVLAIPFAAAVSVFAFLAGTVSSLIKAGLFGLVPWSAWWAIVALDARASILRQTSNYHHLLSTPAEQQFDMAVAMLLLAPVSLIITTAALWTAQWVIRGFQAKAA